MGNLSDAIEFEVKEKIDSKVKKEVTRQSILRTVYNVMKKMNISLEEIMSLLGIPEIEKYYLRATLKK